MLLIDVFTIVSLRKRLFLFSAFLGSFSAIMFLVLPARTLSWVPPSAALLNIIGYTCYSISIVNANAYLPSFGTEEVDLEVEDKIKNDPEQRPLLESQDQINRHEKISLAISHISSTSFGIGCFAAFLGLIVCQERWRFVSVSQAFGGPYSPCRFYNSQMATSM